MCGFFAFTPNMSPRELAEALGVTNLPSSMDDIESLKFYPKSPIPTVSKNSPNQLVIRRWSLIQRWWDKPLEDLKFNTFNARSEDIAVKASYRTPWKLGQRCLIPATWFYEFKAKKIDSKVVKIPYKVLFKNSELFTMAGLYENWKDGDNLIESVTIITCSSALPLKSIHDRQPVIIEKSDREKWLDKSTDMEKIELLLKPTADLECFEIDRGFNTAFGDDVKPSLLELKS